MTKEEAEVRLVEAQMAETEARKAEQDAAERLNACEEAVRLAKEAERAARKRAYSAQQTRADAESALEFARLTPIRVVGSGLRLIHTLGFVKATEKRIFLAFPGGRTTLFHRDGTSVGWVSGIIHPEDLPKCQ